MRKRLREQGEERKKALARTFAHSFRNALVLSTLSSHSFLPADLSREETRTEALAPETRSTREHGEGASEKKTRKKTAKHWSW